MIIQEKPIDYQHVKISHNVAGITPNDKNIDIKLILLEKICEIQAKTGDMIYQFLTADETGSVKCNFYGDYGKRLKPSDIVVVIGGFANLYKGNVLTIYTNKRTKVYKVGEFFMKFSEEPRMSELFWDKDELGIYSNISY
jgi:hypothetical protein